MASAALEWPKKTAARAYGSLARLRRRSIFIYQKTHLIVAPIQSRTRESATTLLVADPPTAAGGDR